MQGYRRPSRSTLARGGDAVLGGEQLGNHSLDPFRREIIDSPASDILWAFFASISLRLSHMAAPLRIICGSSINICWAMRTIPAHMRGRCRGLGRGTWLSRP